MTVEERLTRALHEEADRTAVDTTQLYAGTRRRLADRPVRRVAGAWTSLLVAAVVTVVVVGVVALVQHEREPRTPKPIGNSREGGVEATFICPSQITVGRAGRKQDDSFLPSLRRGPQVAADDLEAPRWSYAEDGTAATLRLGNADGSLASVSTFRRVDAAWSLVSTTKCAGADGGIVVPGNDDLRLGRRDATPYPARGWVADPTRAVLVDDRATYDASGFARHRTVWAAPCGPKICLAGGKPTSYVSTEVAAGRPPVDVTSVLLDPDSMVGRTRSLSLWVVYDADSTVSAVVMHLRDGTDRPARRVTGPGWNGRAYVALGHTDDVLTVEVRRTTGPSTTYPAASISDPAAG